jgi:hypothetical protein
VAIPKGVVAPAHPILRKRGSLKVEDISHTRGYAEPNWRLRRLAKTGGLLDYEQILLDGLLYNARTDSAKRSTRLSDLGNSVFATSLREAECALYADVAKPGSRRRLLAAAHRRMLRIFRGPASTGIAHLIHPDPAATTLPRRSKGPTAVWRSGL